MKRVMTLAAIATVILLTTVRARPDEAGGEPPSARRVELAICLDTSGSMETLIDAARQKLWAIVNDLATLTPTPELRVALLTFGNDGHDAAQGWVRVDAPFTTDLDLISQQLFALATNGGTEFVGRVLDAAGRLDWTEREGVLRIAIVAGNEGADQDQEVRFQDVCPRLIGRGILVNSIYCGPETDELAPAWRDVARLADGRFASIDKDNGTVVITTPFDDQLGALSTDLNTTYLWFGAEGMVACSNQVAQDSNSLAMNTAAVASRAVTKSSGLYRNNNDLIDGCSSGAVKLEEVKDEELPEAMRSMTLEQRRAHVAEQGEKRKGLQEKVAELAKQRDAYVAAEMRRRSLDDGQSFDNAVRSAIREQALAAGFQVAVEPAPPAVEAGQGEVRDC